MLDFVKQYWLEAVFGGILLVLSTCVKYLFCKFKNEKDEREKRTVAESKEQELIKQGVLAILHDRLYQACQYYIQSGEISIEDLNNITHLYESYHNLGGNGTGTEIYNRCKALPLRERGK